MRVAAAAELEWTGFNKNVMEVCIVPVPFTWKYNMHSLAAPCKWLQSTKKHHSMHPLSNQMYHWQLFTEHGRCTNTCFKYFQTKSPTTWVHTQSLRLGALLALISTFTVSRVVLLWEFQLPDKEKAVVSPCNHLAQTAPKRFNAAPPRGRLAQFYIRDSSIHQIWFFARN